jgi:cellobiose phosphorylase
MIYLPLAPEQTARRILEHAAHQHADGTVLHWWHNLTESGPRSRFSDDLLWLPYVVYQQVLETGSDAILDQRVPYLDAPEDTIDGHCRRAIDRALERRSPRGLPLIGEGDWNDGLSSCGDEGRGESIWLGHFLCRVLADYATLCAARGLEGPARTYAEERAALCAAVNAHGWDGEWYLRATLDDGEPIGSARCREGRIFLNAQTWAVIGETAPPDRQAAALQAVKTHLDREHGPLLLFPAYSTPDPRIGYITRYAPGLRENGGVYTHAACWAVLAAAIAGDGEWAYSLYRKVCPVLRGMDPGRYLAEPYVTPGNSDGPGSPRFGRGGWTWYTGSATWLQRVVNEWILGVRPAREGLLVRPLLPRDWRGFHTRRLFRGRVYEIEVTRGSASLIVNGAERDPRSPFLGERSLNQIQVQTP